jgi:uncharacterized protein
LENTQVANVQAFQDCVKSGDLAGVRRLLGEDRTLLNQKNEAGQTAFLLASYYRQREIAEYLLSLGPDLDVHTATVAGNTSLVLQKIGEDPELLEALSTDGWTPLHLAAFFGQKETALALIEQGAIVDSRSTNSMKNTPLHAAAAGRQGELVDLLLNKGADVGAMQTGGWTALHAAAQNGDLAMVQSLIAHGAHILARAENQQTPHDLAMLKGHGEVAELLEELSAK